jgi:hypothetical protein
MIVLKIVPILRNTLAEVFCENNTVIWIYPSQYEVMNSEPFTDSEDTWSQYIGKHVLLIPRNRPESRILTYPPREYIVLRTRETSVLLCDINYYDKTHGYLIIWKNTGEFDVLGVL